MAVGCGISWTPGVGSALWANSEELISSWSMLIWSGIHQCLNISLSKGRRRTALNALNREHLYRRGLVEAGRECARRKKRSKQKKKERKQREDTAGYSPRRKTNSKKTIKKKQQWGKEQTKT